MNRLLQIFRFLPGLVLIFLPSFALSAKTYTGVLGEPVALGAWVYKSKCIRCHQQYSTSRLGGEYDDQQELITAIGQEGCKVPWDRQDGGTLHSNEIEAIAIFMLRWEENDRPPQLPELPPLELDNPKKIINPPPRPGNGNFSTTQQLEILSPGLQHLIDNNSVAHGGYLYTRNCYRCHLSYTKGRMGKSMEKANLRLFIREGKTSTQMKPFSRLLGGSLKNREIEAIVSYISQWENKGEELAIAKELMTPPAFDPTELLPLRLVQFKEINGDQKQGMAIFRLHCSGCHGSGGEGIVGTVLDKRSFAIRPDLYVKSVVKNGVENSVMESWDINKGGELSAKNIEDVVTFILQLPVPATIQ